MPELPEVETTRRGLAPLAEGRRIQAVVIRQSRLRWPIPVAVARAEGQRVLALERRAKWLVWRLEQGFLLWHLGMSGSFRGWTQAPPAGAHDHVDIRIANGHLIRYTDPRRFGPQPFDPVFTGEYLWRASRGRRAAVKAFIMENAVVVGVGNIYACESLFEAGIHPRRPAGRIGRERYERLAAAIVRILGRAIEVGGTSLRDFTTGDGTPGYFGQALKVYGRQGQACLSCGEPIRSEVIGQRNSFYCARCQR